MTAFAVYLDVDIDDPTDPDLLAENVLEGEYEDRETALDRALNVSRDERTMTLVYDLSRPSTVVVGAPLLIAGFENGRPLA
jgi:hypothetical protein